ncbi:MAG: amylo-alpha-1,6-glucosidase [Candidatus Melainabacteria bacterium]|nr:amylo-alpha-1,6-glucosidase [Candidatus Melainabacteria bacterium]
MKAQPLNVFTRFLCATLIGVSSFSTLPASAVENASPSERTLPATAETAVKAAILNHPRLILKNGAHFVVLDEAGLMPAGTSYGYGLYKDDTRYLSSFDLSLNGANPVLLSASTEEGYAGKFIYGNAADAASGTPEQQIMLQRDIVIRDGVSEKITLTNFGNQPVTLNLAIAYANDFADMFEVRGIGRKRRGQLQSVEQSLPNGSLISYMGLDNKLMTTRLLFSETPAKRQGDRVEFQYKLNGQQSKTIEMNISTAGLGEPFAPNPTIVSYDEGKVQADNAYSDWRSSTASVTTSNTEFNKLLERSIRDIYILRQPTPRGICLAAGTPWFAVAFGRDQEITAMETMMFVPELAKDVINILAEYQGTKSDDFTEEKPGRIMHELRLGEMARMREIAFVPYYGTVDATPLWLVLLARYYQQTGDLEFVRKHWPRVESALAYLDSEMQTGYLRYGGKPGAALSNQGWKDSGDSVMYGDGKLAKAPIALCEVQGYLYFAWSEVAHLAELLGHKDRADQLLLKAQKLQQNFRKDFWMKEKNCVALALDGDGRQCDVISSNMGHLLSTNILDKSESNAVADALLRDDMFSQWGVRTLSSKEVAFNPMSYHNGSVWPHDNAMAIEGLCRIGRAADARRVIGGLFETAKYRPDMRLPELFCGFSRTFSDKPVWYPVSCAPQAWAAGSVLQMVSGCLGLVADAGKQTLSVVRPALPPWMERVDVKGIRVGDGSCDLHFELVDGKTKCSVVSHTKNLKLDIQE